MMFDKIAKPLTSLSTTTTTTTTTTSTKSTTMTATPNKKKSNVAAAKIVDDTVWSVEVNESNKLKNEIKNVVSV